MKVIKVSTDNEITVEDSRSFMNLHSLIGEKCDYVEPVYPKRLYDTWNMNDLVMLVDEMGLYHDLDINLIGSWLYETDIHGHPIVGNILFIARDDLGTDFTGLSGRQITELRYLLEKYLNCVRREEGHGN